MNIHRFAGCCAAVLGIGAIALVGCGGGGGGNGSSGTSSGMSTISGRAVQSNGSPASGAKVALLPASPAGSRSKAAIETTTADVNGNFTLTNVAAGTYTVSVSETLPSGAQDTVLVTITVSASATINLTIDLTTTTNPGPQTGSVFGTVRDDTGAAVAGASVMLHSQDDSSLPVLKTTTDVTGSFTFSTVPTGMWLVSVQGKHISSTSRQLVEVQGGASSEVDLTVALGGGGDD